MSGKTSTPVPLDTLLLGALYALEECGRKLASAAVLAERAHFVDAAGLALMAREEMGRHDILLDLWRQAAGGSIVSVTDVRQRCEDHVVKQRRALRGLSYYPEPGSQIYSLIQATMTHSPGSPEWRAAREKLKLLDERKTKDLPGQRHEKRMSAFYVDLDDDGWSRPSDLDPRDCLREVQEAVSDYFGASDKISRWVIHDDKPLAQAIAALPEKPTFPIVHIGVEASTAAMQARESRKEDAQR